MIVPATGLPDIQKAPEVHSQQVRFVQTAGGRAGLPGPRLVSYTPFAHWVPPTVWTTLGLTIRIDGSSDYELIGASPFPRHWLFDASGQLVAKAGLADFRESLSVLTPLGVTKILRFSWWPLRRNWSGTCHP
jgi:hypothetical protein